MKGRKLRRTDEEKAAIIADYERDMGVDAVCKEHGLAESVLWRILNAAGVPRRRIYKRAQHTWCLWCGDDTKRRKFCCKEHRRRYAEDVKREKHEKPFYSATTSEKMHY